MGYWKSGLLFAGLIALVALAHFVLGLGEVLSFWLAYILTRPLGASLGDYLLQKPTDGGLGLGIARFIDPAGPKCQPAGDQRHADGCHRRRTPPNLQ